jgi:hypothetical protein
LGERKRVLRPGSRIVIAVINVSGAQNVHGSQPIELLIGGQVDFAVAMSVNFLDDILGVSFAISQGTKTLWATFAIHSVENAVKCLVAALHRVFYKQTCTVSVLQAIFSGDASWIPAVLLFESIRRRQAEFLPLSR